MLFPLRLKLQNYYALIENNQKYKTVILIFCIFVTLFGPLDIYINGFKLLNPESYTVFNGIGRYIRHITTLSWILIPITFIFINNRPLKFLLFFYALLFPILIVDRNRLFLSSYTFILCYSLSGFINNNNKNKLTFKLTVVMILAYLFFIAGFLISAYLLKKFPNIFTLLIFIKISFCTLFMNFAPQYYLLLNVMFCLFMLFLWFMAASLNVGIKKNKVWLTSLLST